jgi:HEAT repeat protein
MIRNIKKKHGLIYLGILLLFSFVFVSRCIETTSKVPQKSSSSYTQLNETQVYLNLNSDSVISRREALSYIKTKKLKQYIPNLKNIINRLLTSEDRRLAAETLGTVSDIENIKDIFALISNNDLKDSRSYYLKAVITYLGENPDTVSFISKLGDKLGIITDILGRDENSLTKRDALKVVRLLKYNNAFDAVLKLTSVVELKPEAISTLASIANDRQKPYVVSFLKKMLLDEANTIIRRYIKLSIASLEKPELSANPEVIALLSDAGSKSVSARRKAFKKLSKLPPHIISPYLVYSIGDEEKRVRIVCAKLIAKLQLSGFEEKLDLNISQMLVYLKGHKEYDLATDCAKISIFALSKLKTQKAFDIIKKYIFNYRVKDAAYAAIASFDNQDVLPILNNGMLSETEDLKSIIAEASFVNNKLDVFTKNIKSPNEYVRLLAVKYLSKLKTETSMNTIKEALKNEYVQKWKDIYQMALDNSL